MNRVRTTEPEIAPIVWHDLECGSYHADLPLWRELAARGAAPGESCRVLDLGCGTGRVSLDLAAEGHRVTGLDLDPRLTAELRRRAAAQHVAVGGITGDARSFRFGRRFDLVLAALQFLQLLTGREERIAALVCVRAHLADGGLFAAALLDLSGESTDDDYHPPLPDMSESAGWVWSSQPVEVRLLEGGSALALDRHRRAVSPRGEVAESEDRVRLELLSCDDLEQELREAGIEPIERRAIAATDDHVGSIAVIGEVRRD
jgi:SAM-dependent methyltransferase